jgi:hypothetical protein
MSEVLDRAVVLDEPTLASLRQQVADLPPGEPYLAVVAGDKVFVRSTKGMTAHAVRMWHKHPEAMIPPDMHPDYREALVIVSPEDL